MVQVRSIGNDGSKWVPGPLHQCKWPKKMETLAKVKPKDEEKRKKTAERGAANVRSSLKWLGDDGGDNQEGSCHVLISVCKSFRHGARLE